MDFNLTNGTISSLTITTDNNIDSATVTGADYVINENTITLTNLTSSLILELTGEIPGINKIHIGTLNTKNFYFGTLGISAIYLGQYLVYAKGTPTEEATFELSDGKYLYVSNGDYFDAADISLISFTIGANTYQAESGMTWSEWVNSEYNTAGYFVNVDTIIRSGGGAGSYYVNNGSTEKIALFEITANGTYSEILYSGGAGL